MPRLIEFKDRAEWLASRSREPWPIGASDAAKIACGKLCEVWCEKKLGQRLDSKAMPFLELGHCLEGGILEAGRRILGWEMDDFCQTHTWAHDRLDWARCTPDGVRCGMGSLRTVNAKNVSWQNPRFSDYRNELIPDDHRLGAQWECFVADAPEAYILALVGGSEVVPFTIERDDDVILGLYKACKEFRDRYLIGDEEPEPDGSEATARALSRRAKYEPESEVYLSDISPEADEAACRIDELKPSLDTTGAEYERCRNVVRQAMKGAQRAISSNGRVFKWTTNGQLR